MKQINKIIKNGQTFYLSDSALTQSVDTIVQELNNLSIPDSTSDLINDSNFVSVSSVTQAQYDALPTSAKTDNVIWVITDVTPSGGGASYTAGANIDIANNVISVTGMPTDVSDLYNDEGYLTPSDFKTINNQSIVGSGNIQIQGGGGVSVIEISQADYDNLPTSAKTDTTKIYVISGATSNYYTKSEVDALIPTSTSDLTNDSNFVASTNLKTVGSQSIVGSGNISFKTINNLSVVGNGNIVVPTFTYDSSTQTLNITTT